MRLLRTSLLLLVSAALVFGVAACGDDDDDNSGGGGSAAATDTQSDTAAAARVALGGEETVLVLDPDTAGVLEENEVTVEPTDPAAPAGEGIGFPIAGGEVDAESLAGTIEHQGGLTFSAGGEEVALSDFVVDTTAGTLSASTPDGAQVPTLALDLDGLQRSMDGDVIVAEGIEATLTAEAADALNQTFAVELFEEGLPIGDVTVRAAG